MSLPRYPRYKDSGVEWLGEVPDHWEVLRLQQLGRLLKGSGGSKEDIVEEGVPCVRYGDIYTTHSYFIREARTNITEDVSRAYTPILFGDILFAASGEKIEEIGKSAVNLMTWPAFCGGDIILLRPSTSVCALFWGFAADSHPSNVQKASMGRGTTVKHIYPGELKRLLVAAPPPEEQTWIAAFLVRETAKIDALVAEQQRLIELLKEKRQAVISHAVTRGLNPAAPMKDSGIEWLGEVPAHWLVRRLKTITPRLAGRLIVQPHLYFDDVGVPIIFGSNISAGRIVADDLRLISKQADEQFAACRARSGDLLTVRVGAPGETAVVPVELDGCHFASTMLIRQSPAFHSPWLCHVMNSAVVRAQIERANYGAAQEQFNISDAANFQIPCPPADEQVRISAWADHTLAHLDSLTTEVQSAITLLQERRAALISAAVTGQIDVRHLTPEPQP